MKSDLPRLSKRGQRNLSVSCLASWAAFEYTGRDWLNWLLRWLPSFSYQSAIKKITSWFNGPGLLSAPSRQKPCTFPGIWEEPTSGQSAAWRSHCVARKSQPSCRASVWMGRTLFRAQTTILSMKFTSGHQSKNKRCISSLFFPIRLSSEKYSLKSQYSNWNWW